MTIDKQVCAVQQAQAQGCTSGAQAITVTYTGSAISPGTVTLTGSNGRAIAYTFSEAAAERHNPRMSAARRGTVHAVVEGTRTDSRSMPGQWMYDVQSSAAR